MRFFEPQETSTFQFLRSGIISYSIMSAFPGLEQINVASIVAASCHFYEFRLPRSKPVNFLTFFKNYTEEQATHSFLTSLNEARASFMRELGSPSAFEAKIFAVDAYIPLLLQFLHSLTNQPPVEITGAMIFEWRGAFTTFEGYNQYPELIYEVAMVFHTKSVLHYNAANAYAGNESTLSNAGQNLLTAANILDYLLTVILPRWFVSPSTPKAARPPEVSESVCEGLIPYFRGCAQRMALCKALLKAGGTASSTLSKLTSSIVTDSKIGLSNILAQYGGIVDGDFIVHVRYQVDLSTALAYYFYARASYEKGEIGASVGCFLKSLVRKSFSIDSPIDDHFLECPQRSERQEI